MTTTSLACPDCGAALTGAPACAACRLPLVGPQAARLWQVDSELTALGARRDVLLRERRFLLGALRAPDVGLTVAEPTAAGPESSPRQVQNTLLSLGALLLAVAGVVFAAVTYDRLGLAGRAAVLVALTAAAAAAPVALRRRGLSASAEALGAVAVVLAALDLWALRRAGVAGGTEGLSYAAVSTALLAGGAAAYAAVVPLRTVRLAATGLGQLPLPLLLLRLEAPLELSAVALAALAVADLAAAARYARDLGRPLRSCGTAVLLAALACAVLAAPGNARSAPAFVAVAAALCAGWAGAREAVRAALSAASVVLLCAAVVVAAQAAVPGPQLPAVAGACALAAALGAAAPSHRDPALRVGAALVGAAALLAVLQPAVAGVAGPTGWLLDPWTLQHGEGARSALSPRAAWSGSGTTALTVGMCAAAALADRLRRPSRLGAALVAGLLAVTVGLVPLGLDLPYPLAVGLLVVAVVVLAAAASLAAAGPRVALGVAAGPRVALGVAAGLQVALGVAAGLVALQAALAAVADERTTLVVLPLLAVVAAAAALGTDRAAAAAATAAGLLGGAELAAGGAARGLTGPQVGTLLLLAPAALLGAAGVLRDRRRAGLEVAAAALALAAVLLSTDDPGALSVSLAGAGLLTLADSLRGDRRALAVPGGLLLSASSWVRLAESHVTAPEPYVLPLAGAALVLGWLRRRAAPATGSFAAYGSGLALLLGPSLVAATTDARPLRALLLLVGAAGVVLVGARARLRAPLVAGGLVLAADGLVLLAPYAAALPRWTVLAAVGAALVGAGATYEQRRQDLARLRDRYASLA